MEIILRNIDSLSCKYFFHLKSGRSSSIGKKVFCTFFVTSKRNVVKKIKFSIERGGGIILEMKKRIIFEGKGEGAQ